MMMRCKDFTSLVASGRLREQASAAERCGAVVHRWMCRNCRAFERNNAALDGLLADYRAHLEQQPDDAPPADARAAP